MDKILPFPWMAGRLIILRLIRAEWSFYCLWQGKMESWYSSASSGTTNADSGQTAFQSAGSSDWGYFGKGTINIICSSHQDIAWMNTPDSCREDRIHDIIIPALDIIDKNPAYRFEMEQTLNLMEVLDEVPSEKAKDYNAFKKGQFTWGATFNQPYEGLESGEQLVRQAYLGRKWIKENLPGMDALAAYNVDVPGRSSAISPDTCKSRNKISFCKPDERGLL